MMLLKNASCRGGHVIIFHMGHHPQHPAEIASGSVGLVLHPAGLERIRAAKLGILNPNHQGLSPQHREKIAQTMRAQRQGEHHHFYNMHHSPRS